MQVDFRKDYADREWERNFCEIWTTSTLVCKGYRGFPDELVYTKNEYSRNEIEQIVNKHNARLQLEKLLLGRSNG